MPQPDSYGSRLSSSSAALPDLDQGQVLKHCPKTINRCKLLKFEEVSIGKKVVKKSYEKVTSFVANSR